MDTEIETSNDQMVSANTRGNIRVLMPKTIMNKEQALRHAAWLVAMATVDRAEFDRVLEAVVRTPAATGPDAASGLGI